MPIERRPLSRNLRKRTNARRAADRHYVAVVAAEARRLGRQLRAAGTRGMGRPKMTAQLWSAP